MRIVSDTADRLTLEEKPWVIGIILAAMIVFLLALALGLGRTSLWAGLGLTFGAAIFAGAFVAFVRRVIVIFDRAAGAVVIRTASVLGQREQTLALADLDSAFVQTTTSISTTPGSRLRNSNTTHRPALRVRGGEPVPLMEVYSSGSGAERMVAVVNRWLSAPEA